MAVWCTISPMGRLFYTTRVVEKVAPIRKDGQTHLQPPLATLLVLPLGFVTVSWFGPQGGVLGLTPSEMAANPVALPC